MKIHTNSQISHPKYLTQYFIKHHILLPEALIRKSLYEQERYKLQAKLIFY